MVGGPVATTVRAVLLGLLAASAGCHRQAGSHAGPLPELGRHVVVLAPHPDDEVLGAAGVLAAAARSGALTTVAIATDGEAGRNESRAKGDLASMREAESRRALARIGVADRDVLFLHYPDSGLTSAWSEQWATKRRDGSVLSGRTILDEIQATIGEPAATTVILPSPMDHHPDHRALARFGLLAVLAGRARGPMPQLLGYLIHAGPGWPEGAPADACAAAVFPWVALPLDADAVRAKAVCIADYASQAGPRLLYYAAPTEPFTVGLVVRPGDAPTGPAPQVQRTAEGVAVELRRSRCVLPAGSGGRLRLRFVTAVGVEERVIPLVAAPTVTGGTPGAPLVPAHDVDVRSTADAIQVVLGGDLPAQAGALLEVLPDAPAKPAPAWLLLW